MDWKTCLAIAGFVAASVTTLGGAHALDDARNGKRLAAKWCASCHLVSPDQTIASADAPPFMTIAKRSEEDLARLSSFLKDPHPKMPNLGLSRQAIADLIAYIRSLKP